MFTASAIQFAPKLAFSAAEVKSNLRRATKYIDLAGSLGSDLIVLPELAFTGYSFLNDLEAGKVAERFDGPTFKEMQKLAASYEAYIAYGFVENIDDVLYNSCNLIGPNGVLLDNYQKINLWGPDFLWAKSGQKPPKVIDTPHGTLGTVICRDIKISIPNNIPRTASTKPFFQKVPSIIAACTNWGKAGFPPNVWLDMCANNNTTLVLSNRYGVETNNGMDLDFGTGGSAIIEPSWKIHMEGLKFGTDCCVTARLDNRSTQEI